MKTKADKKTWERTGTMGCLPPQRQLLRAASGSRQDEIITFKTKLRGTRGGIYLAPVTDCEVCKPNKPWEPARFVFQAMPA